MSDFPLNVTLGSDNPCHGCGGQCCVYITAIIAEPDDVEDFDHMIWQVSHENIEVYHDGEDWILGVINSKCQYLGPNGQCMNYEERPFICRDFSPDTCGKGEDLSKHHLLHFRTPDDVDAYCRKRFGGVWLDRVKDHAAGKYKVEDAEDVDDGADGDEEDNPRLDRLTALEIRFDDLVDTVDELVDVVNDGFDLEDEDEDEPDATEAAV